jgi:hypothetical protein
MGLGRPTHGELVVMSESDGWVQWPGRWGGTMPSGEFPLLEDSSPHGPAYASEHEQWFEPTAWAEGLETGGGCP